MFHNIKNIVIIYNMDKKLDLTSLKEDFDNDSIYCILELTVESITKNINLINNGLKNKNQKEVFRGCHTLKSLGFLGTDIFVVKKSTILTHIVRDKDFDKINLVLFSKIFSEFIVESAKLETEIKDILDNKNI